MKPTLATHLVLALAVGAIGVACSSGDDDSASGLGSGGKGGAGGKGNVAVGGKSTIPTTGGTSGTGPGGNTGGTNGAGTGNTGPYTVPAGYVPANDGGWKLGDAVTKDNAPDVGEQGSMGCGTTILGIVRDFKRGDGDRMGHKDFETFTGSGQDGMVLEDLGDDNKPVYNEEAPKRFTTTKANFDQWYNDVPDTNAPYYIFFSLEPNGQLAEFDSRAFFPLDGDDANVDPIGFGQEGFSHNFNITTEVHTTFRYNGGEHFEFTGDDDLWVFINKKLAIDLGGLHSSLSEDIQLDDEAARLGIVKGGVYALDLFHAERHSAESNFNIISNLHFVDCGVIVPSGPVK